MKYMKKDIFSNNNNLLIWIVNDLQQIINKTQDILIIKIN